MNTSSDFAIEQNRKAQPHCDIKTSRIKRKKYAHFSIVCWTASPVIVALEYLHTDKILPSETALHRKYSKTGFCYI